MIEEASFVSEEIRSTGSGVSRVVTQEVVIEHYDSSQVGELEERIAKIDAAIADIDNFKARRLANLVAEKEELEGYIVSLETLDVAI